ncbi:hypothetical protein GW17_00025920, partial [Ensete ventricosum]
PRRWIGIGIGRWESNARLQVLPFRLPLLLLLSPSADITRNQWVTVEIDCYRMTTARDGRN